MSNEYAIVRYLPRPGAIPGQGITVGDWNDRTERIEALEAGIDLGDINDVDLTGLADGYVLVRDADTSTWVPVPMQSGIEVYANGSLLQSAAIGLNFHTSLTTTVSGLPGGPKSVVQVAYDGSGSANTAARSDHVHNAKLVSLTTGAATGVLSSGTRVLRDAAGPALSSSVTYDVTALFKVRARNNVDSGTVNLFCRVGAEGGYPQRTRNVQTVGGVPVDQDIQFHAVITGTGASVDEYFAVQHSTGSVTDLRDWEVLVQYDPRR